MVRRVGVCRGEKAVQLFLPAAGFLDENGFGFFLEAFLDFVDFGRDWAESFDFALVLSPDDFLESPLKHEIVALSLKGGFLHL